MFKQPIFLDFSDEIKRWVEDEKRVSAFSRSIGFNSLWTTKRMNQTRRYPVKWEKNRCTHSRPRPKRFFGSISYVTKNESDRDIEFTFNTSQKFELSVYDEDGNEKYRYSKDRMFTQAIQSFVLKADETYDFQDTWSNGVEPGTYEAVVTFKGKAEGLKQITEKKTFQVK